MARHPMAKDFQVVEIRLIVKKRMPDKELKKLLTDLLDSPKRDAVKDLAPLLPDLLYGTAHVARNSFLDWWLSYREEKTKKAPG